MTHTPKPWIVRTDTAIVNLVVSPPGEPAIAGIFPQYGADGEPKYDIYAHAYLIATAPELLEMLESIAFIRNNDGYPQCPICYEFYVHDKECKLSAVIRKAKGEQP